ncbi:MAG: phenylalanine--tRNA ligase subunit beta, partial [Gammaproteobacteria bacterium]
PSASKLGQALNDCLGLDDHIFDISLTPNRGDCFCAIGIARDLEVLNGKMMEEPVIDAVQAQSDRSIAVELAQPEACARYAGRVIEGVDPKAVTPLWMRERLRRVGIRSIHPLVDVTNYVMLELGQPMHAFDLEKLQGGIIVRPARAGETLQLLDGQSVTLDSQTLVIADHEHAVALAGVMGGQMTGVTETTTTVFLESAFFDPVRLAGVARRYRLHTDASTRFERGVDPVHQERAIERATALIVDICGGTPGPTDVAEAPAHIPQSPTVTFDPGAVNRLLGTGINDAQSEEILRNLKMEVDSSAAVWKVTPPSFRFDIALEADLVEEVARITGYDEIPVRFPRAAQQPAVSSRRSVLEQRARRKLVDRGYHEAITYSFISSELAELFCPDDTRTQLANPISSEMSIMRPSLWPGLVQAAIHNRNRQHEDLRLFESGLVFSDLKGSFAQLGAIAGVRGGNMYGGNWALDTRSTDFFDLKQDVVELLQIWQQTEVEAVAEEVPALHPGQSAILRCNDEAVGYFGTLHPAIQARLDISIPLYLFEIFPEYLGSPALNQFAPFSKFPAVRRDLNIVVDESVTASACLAAVKGAAGAHLRDLQLFDVYRGQGIDSDKKSLTLGLIFQDVSSTLTEDEVDAAINPEGISLMALTKAEMAERLFEDLGLNKREAKELVEAFFEEVRASLEGGQQVKLSGFGNFDLRDKNQRPGRNPK